MKKYFHCDKDVDDSWSELSTVNKIWFIFGVSGFMLFGFFIIKLLDSIMN